MAEPQALEAARWFLALFFPGVALFYIVRLTARRRRLGHSAVWHGVRGSRHWWLAKTFVVFRSVITLAMLARAFWPGLDSYLLAWGFLMTPTIVFAGLIVMITGFSSAIALHFSMGRAWRSGLPAEGGVPGLITGGPFAWSRNPMFLAIQLAQFGFFLSFPSGFTLICLLVGMLVLHLQVRLEEAHLLAAHGQVYRDYCKSTARWFALGRLPFASRADTTSRIVTH